MANRHLRILLSLAYAIWAIGTSAQAKGAHDLSDLVGARGSSGELELESRGFTHIITHEGGRYAKHSYWWNAHDKSCIHVETYEGHYSQITDATKSDCHQRDKHDSAAAAAVIGALIVGTALASKSHHRQGRDLNSNQMEEFNRGYRDGLYGGDYHNYGRDESYADGYQAGVDERNANLRDHTHRGGYVQVARYSDLRGADAISAIDRMTSRGFKNVDTITSANTIYGIYYRSASQQCVQMTLADDRVYDIRDIETHPKCR